MSIWSVPYMEGLMSFRLIVTAISPNTIMPKVVMQNEKVRKPVPN